MSVSYGNGLTKYLVPTHYPNLIKEVWDPRHGATNGTTLVG